MVWGFFWCCGLVFFNVLKCVHTCIPTHVDFQVEKTLSNTHSLQFEGLYMFLITACPFPNVFSLEQFGRTNKASSYSVSCCGSVKNNYCPSSFLLFGTDLTHQRSSFDFMSNALPHMEPFEHLNS